MLVANRPRSQAGQVMVLVAVAMLALIGSAALVLIAGSAEWQKNQLQELADSTALDSALTIGIGCDPASAPAVIRNADRFLALRRGAGSGLIPTAGTCATPYRGTDTFNGGTLTATINYPYRAHQQQVEVILTLTLPIAFGGEVGVTKTTVVRRAVAQGLSASVPAISATNLTCVGGRVNIGGSVVTQNRIVRNGACVLYAHARLAPPPGTYSDLGNISVYADGQVWRAGAGSSCLAPISRAICADGYELSGHLGPACPVIPGTSFLSPGDRAVNPNPCAPLTGPQPVPPLSANWPPDPNLDPNAYGSLIGTGGANCKPGTVYPNIQVPNPPGPPVVVGTGLGPVPLKDGAGYYHFKPSCYGYLNIRRLPARPDTLPRLAVLDPGFYYFNGSGSPGGGRPASGGGICLNDSTRPPQPPLPARNVTLLARNVTLEFVNQAGFSSGECTAGGGADCAALCQFGSEPCSLRPCPPNVGADPPNDLTWFAAPCSVAVPALRLPSLALPGPDTASCAGPPLWCVARDRACSNLLIWAPPGATGQISLKGPAERAWLFGTVYWPGTCTDNVNGTSRIAGAIACGNLSIQAPAGGAGIAVGNDFGINTATVEAVLVE